MPPTWTSSSLADHLTALGVGNSGPIGADYGTALSCADPDGIALDFFVTGPAV